METLIYQNYAGVSGVDCWFTCADRFIRVPTVLDRYWDVTACLARLLTNCINDLYGQPSQVPVISAVI